MGEHMPRPFPGEALEHALRTARLDVPAERAETVRSTAEAVYALLDELDSLELGETPPATALDARWE
jgi:Asp-tRNA(Asn)/Glu-tRNA(Gln) amidotransferase C subunit